MNKPLMIAVAIGLCGFSAWMVLRGTAVPPNDEPQLERHKFIPQNTVTASFSVGESKAKLSIESTTASNVVLEGAIVDDQSPQALDAQALAYFRQSLNNDDPRAPPIHHTEPGQSPAQEILDDPQLYREYEAQQRRNLLTSFVAQAQRKQQQLEALIAKGKATGIDPNKLAEGEKKLAALKKGIVAAQQDLP